MNIFKALVFIIFFLFTISIFPQTTHVVEASDYVFTPADLTIMKGDTVKWVWVNGMHTTTSDTTEGATVWNALLDQNHPTFSYVFNQTGVFSYYCIYHVSFGMKGTITVGPATSVKSAGSLPNSYILEQNYILFPPINNQKSTLKPVSSKFIRFGWNYQYPLLPDSPEVYTPS